MNEGARPFELLAKCRIALACLNFPIAYLSYQNPYETSISSLLRIQIVCAGFLLWMVVSYGLLKRLRRFEASVVLLPCLDLAATIAFIAATGGAEGPFTPWMYFVAFGTVAARQPWQAVLVGGLSMGGVVFVTYMASDVRPIVSLTVVRTIWTAMYASFAYLVGNAYEQHVRLLDGLEALNAEMAVASDAAQALDAFRSMAERRVQPSSVVMRLEVSGAASRPRHPLGPNWFRVPIASGGHDFGEAQIGRRRRFSGQERRVLLLGGERLAATLQRLQLVNDLVEEAVRQERLALADELHDTTIQTLTLFDLEASRLARLVGSEKEASIAQSIADQARAHIGHVRGFLRQSVHDQVPGPETLRALLEERWKGAYEIRLDPGIRLTEGRWRLVGLMAREGSNNARKHGGATHVRLEVGFREDGFEARLEADGATPPADVRPGYGLTRLRAVAAAQHAMVELRPRPGGGSILAVRDLGEKTV